MFGLLLLVVFGLVCGGVCLGLLLHLLADFDHYFVDHLSGVGFGMVFWIVVLGWFWQGFFLVLFNGLISSL